MPNLNKRIVDLPLILANDISSLDVLPIVNVEADVTNKVTIGELANYFDSSDTFLTGVTYNTLEDNLTLSLNNGTSLSADIPRYNRWYIPSGQTYTIENKFQSFIYGDLVVEGTLNLEPEGQLIVLNGDIILSGGSIVGSGTTYAIDLPEYNVFVTGGTYNSGTKSIDFSGNLGFPPFAVDLTDLKFTGNTSGDCISDIFVSNIHSCSPLNINPNGEGNVIFGDSITGVTIDVVNSKITTSDLGISTTPTTNNSLPSVLVRDFDGSIRLRDASTIGGTISYNRILVVDPIYGNNGTGTPDRFDKPYSTVAEALSVANGLSKSILNRVLIYVRAGQHTNQYMFLKDNVDIYCEPGVVFTLFTRITDVFEAGPVNSRFLGYAKFDNLNYTGSPLITIQKASNVILEFDSIYYSSTILFCADVTASGTTSEVILKCNRIESTQTLGAGWAINCRNNSNVRIIVSDYIKANHNILYFRISFNGKAIIDCPKIILTATNLYGSNFDHCVLVESSFNGSKIIINGDLYSEKPSFGGNASCLLINGGGDCDVELNGNVYGNNSVGVWLNMTSVNGKIKVNGDIKSVIRPIILANTGNAHFKNSDIVLAPTTIYDALIYTNHTGKVFFTNCNFNCEKDDTHTFISDGTIGTIMISNSNSYTTGVNGEFFHSNAGAMTIKTHNVRANKPLGVNVTDLLSPSGFIQDSNIITPNF